jgi:hypothetical protein
MTSRRSKSYRLMKLRGGHAGIAGMKSDSGLECSDMADLDKVVVAELVAHRRRVGRELSGDEIAEVHASPTHHGWIRYCQSNHEHNARRLRAQGYTLVERLPGVWGWGKVQ